MTAWASGACDRVEVSTPPARYPAARMVDSVDELHGTRVPDPYRWMEDLESSEVRDWAAAQTALAVPILRDNDVRPWLLNRVEELHQFWTTPDDEASEPALIDERALALAPGQTVEDIWPSHDRQHAAYSISTSGSEWVETRIRRLSDSVDLDERLEGLLWYDPTWTKDNRGFFYVRNVKPAPSERTALKDAAVFYHMVGTPQSRDVPIFRVPTGSTNLVLVQEMSADGRFLFVYEVNGAHVDGIGWLLTRMHALDLVDPLRPRITNPVRPLNGARDAAYRILATNGDSVYLFTDRGAPRRRLVVFDVNAPAPEHWRDVVPQTEDVIDLVHDINGHWVVLYLRNVQHGIRVYARSGNLVRELDIPPMTFVSGVRAGANRDELVVDATEGLATTRKRYNIETGGVTTERGVKRPSPADAFEMKQVWYPSKDGTRVPMFLLHRRGLKLDGSHPAVLSGYGASSQLALPYFDEGAIASLELGFVIGLPALRGGGEFGRAWYEAATLQRKQTSIDDFIAAAEFMVREKYTSPERLAIIGASNGGLLVAATINQRPDLFRAAFAGVPQTDNIRYDRGRHASQFGTAEDPKQFASLLAYSPLHNVKPRTCYPSTLITTALNDERAPASMALKYTAALQAAQSCDRPILLRADTAGGHMGSGPDDAADVLSFVATQLGVKPPPE